MTIINVNSISGISSITAQGASGIEFFDSSGSSVQKVTGDGLTVGTGASVHNPASNVLTLGTNNEERIRINSTGNVGIGTTLTGASSNTKLTLQTTDSSACRLVLANSGSSTAESTQIWSQNDELAFNAGGSEQARITADGLKLASGNGINFSAYATSGNPSSNLLDDYEEGTFTAEMNFGNLSVSSHTTTLGAYVKVGRIVKCDIYIRFNGANLSGTPVTGGQVYVSGLPFAGSSTGSAQWMGSPTAVGRLPEYRGRNDSTDFNKIYFYMSNNQSIMYLGVNKDPQSPISTDFLYGLSEKSFSGLIGQNYNFELRAGITYIAAT